MSATACAVSVEAFREKRDLALKIARGIYRTLPRSVQFEDVEQAALIGLWDALRKATGEHCPEQRRVYLNRRIRGSVIDELRRQDWLPRRNRGQEQPAGVYHLDDLSSADQHLAERGPAGTTLVDRLLQAEAVEGALAAPLDARERTIVRKHYYGGRPLSEIARDIGVSEPRISQLHARALRKMRRHVDAKDEPTEQGTNPTPIRGLEVKAVIEATPKPVPSVLPEEGLDLPAELARYRDWLIEQALLRTNGRVHAAAKLVRVSAGTIYARIRDGRCARKSEPPPVGTER